MTHESSGIIINALETPVMGSPVKVRDCLAFLVGLGVGYLIFG